MVTTPHVVADVGRDCMSSFLVGGVCCGETRISRGILLCVLGLGLEEETKGKGRE